jgi:UDP-2,3-diacylglucosamine pyrophosphatase LpxH
MVSAAVISDVHFGSGSSTLSDVKKAEQLIWEIWRYGGGCDELVLLGDIFDFWRTRPERAIRESRPFLKKLSELDLKMTYVVGNHDHHLVVMNRENNLQERVARGDLFSLYTPCLAWRLVIDGMSFDMRYPMYNARIAGKNLLFAHGHHLGGEHAFSVQVVRGLRKLSGEQITPADIEMLMTYAYESIYRSSSVGEMMEIEERLWRASDLFKKVKTGIFGTKYTPVEKQYDSILKFIRDHYPGKVDGFIYGDTHRAGLFRKDGGPLAVNTGSFIHENGKVHLEHSDTYLLYSEDGLFLRQLGRAQELISYHF